MDNKITCPNHEGCEKRLSRLEERYDELREQLWEFDKKSEVTFAKVTSALENLADLPQAMNEMTTTMVAMKDSIHDNGVKTDELASTVKNLSSRVSELDSRDKMSILAFLKANWPIIVAAVLFAGYIIADAAKELLS